MENIPILYIIIFAILGAAMIAEMIMTSKFVERFFYFGPVVFKDELHTKLTDISGALVSGQVDNNPHEEAIGVKVLTPQKALFKRDFGMGDDPTFSLRGIVSLEKDETIIATVRGSIAIYCIYIFLALVMTEKTLNEGNKASLGLVWVVFVAVFIFSIFLERRSAKKAVSELFQRLASMK